MRELEDGKLWMRASGYGGLHDQEHWAGYHAVSPGEPDYPFWLWLLSHRENYLALVDDKQLAQIKEDWQQATK